MKKLTKDEFVLRAKEIHGDKYDYSKTKYVNSNTKVCVLCREHGEFWVTPSNHLRGRKCPICARINSAKIRSFDTDTFVKKAREVHGNRYDYSKTEYIDTRTKVCIICPVHGIFWQAPNGHLSGRGCSKCAGKESDRELFIQKSQEVHGGKYDYSKVDYKGARVKVCVICPIHGKFFVTPSNHQKGRGCPKCAIEGSHKEAMLKKEEVIKRFREIHGDKYNYSLVDYNGVNRLVDIICPKHGVFKQTPYRHMIGNGCPKCSNSQGENSIIRVLDKYNVKYEYQYKILLNLILWGKKELRVDFYLPQENMIIEYNGIQHYEEVKHFHEKDNGFEKQKARDRKLKKWCEDNNIKLLVIKYTQKERIEEILKQHINLDKYERN